MSKPSSNLLQATLTTQAASPYTWDSYNASNIQCNAADLKEFTDLLESGAEESNPNAASVRLAGCIVKGTVVEITKDYVVVDVGQKSEGLVSVSEFPNLSEISIGSLCDVLIDQTEDENGQMCLSYEKADRIKQWENISKNAQEGSIVIGEITHKVKGGLIVNIGETGTVEAFLPGSQIDNKRIKSLDDYIGHRLEFKIIKINMKRKNIVISRRELLEACRNSNKAKMLETLKEGSIVKGTVKNITDFGVFLDLDGVDGLLHITDMSWKRIKHPSEMVTLGAVLEVKILTIDKDKGRIALGLKQLEPNPWDQIESKYPPGTVVEGKIVNLLSYGAFIELEPGVEGLIHVSEMSWTKTISDPNEIVKKGQTVKAIVLSVQKADGKISLGIKQTEDDPWKAAVLKYPISEIVTVEVIGLNSYGAFVEVEPGINGLVHISDLSWTKKISHPSETLKKGDKISAKILSVDTENKKITLGVKQLGTNPWDVIKNTMPEGSIVEVKIAKTTAFGVFVNIVAFDDVEALIHSSELSDASFATVDEAVKRWKETQGDKPLTARVLKLDSEAKKIALSCKDPSANNDGGRDKITVPGRQAQGTASKSSASLSDLSELLAAYRETKK